MKQPAPESVQQLAKELKERSNHGTDDLYELVAAGILSMRYLKGEIYSLTGGESSQQFFLRSIEELFGLPYSYPPKKKRSKR
jgi:hypothetical protein